MSQLGGGVKEPRKLVIYRGVCRERFRCLRATHLRISLGLYDVSVRSLAALARMCPGGDHSNPMFTHHIRRLPPHGLSPPRSCPRLVLQLSGNIWHTASFSIPVLRTGDWSSFGRLHPTSSRPCWAYREPERRSPAELKWTIYRRRPVTAVVELNRLAGCVVVQTDGHECLTRVVGTAQT